MQITVVPAVQVGEAIEGPAFTVDDLARACGVAPAWIHDRVEAGILQPAAASADLRFDSLTLVRARRVLQIEVIFDADPQLAALAADLIEEIARLKQRLVSAGITAA